MFLVISKLKQGLKKLKGIWMSSDKTLSVFKHFSLVGFVFLAGFIICFGFAYEWSEFDKSGDKGGVL